MRLLETEGKELLREFGARVPPGRLATSVDEAVGAARELGMPVAVKAQVAAGKRGKHGGVLRASTLGEAADAFRAVLDSCGGTAALVEPWLTHSQELYVSLTISPEGGSVLMLSAAGGMDVESDTGETNNLRAVPIDPFIGLRPYHVYRALGDLGIAGAAASGIVGTAMALYRAYVARDATLVEVNPLAIDDQGQPWVLDAKVVVDDFALFRQPGLRELSARKADANPLEREMGEHGLQYIGLGGDVGILSIGAGMTMALIDWLTVYGARAACFIDYVGAARLNAPALRAGEFPDIFAGHIEYALRKLLALPVRSLLINVTSGGTPVDGMTRGFLAAFERTKARQVPVAYYVNGNGRDRARTMLLEAGISPMPTLGDAVRLAANG